MHLNSKGYCQEDVSLVKRAIEFLLIDAGHQHSKYKRDLEASFYLDSSWIQIRDSEYCEVRGPSSDLASDEYNFQFHDNSTQFSLLINLDLATVWYLPFQRDK